MRIRIRPIVLLVMLIWSAAGCTQTGPFITSVSSSEPNKLLIEKCHVHMNAFMGTVSNDACTTHEITLHVQSNSGE